MSALFSLHSSSTLARALHICVPMALLGAAEPLLGPTVLSGLGIEQAVLSLGSQRLVLLAPVADAILVFVGDSFAAVTSPQQELF